MFACDVKQVIDKFFEENKQTAEKEAPESTHVSAEQESAESKASASEDPEAVLAAPHAEGQSSSQGAGEAGEAEGKQIETGEEIAEPEGKVVEGEDKSIEGEEKTDKDVIEKEGKEEKEEKIEKEEKEEKVEGEGEVKEKVEEEAKVEPEAKESVKAEQEPVKEPQEEPKADTPPEVPSTTEDKPNEGEAKGTELIADGEDGQKAEECEDVLQETPEKEGRYPLLEKLLSLLSCPKPLNNVLAGYFSKVFGAILEKHKTDLLKYFFRYPEHLDNMITHSYNKSIADLLGRMLVTDDQYEGAAEEYGPQKREILDRLIDKMDPENATDDITNNCYILCGLVDSKQFVDYFTGAEVLGKLFKLAASPNPISLRGVLTIMIILNRQKIPTEAPGFMGMRASEEAKETEADFSEVVRCSVGYLEYGKKYLQEENKNKEVDMPYGESLIPFGLDRLKVVEWIFSLIPLKEEAIASKLLELNMGEVLLSLIGKYYMNTVLHQKVHKIFDEALKTNMETCIEAVYFYTNFVVHYQVRFGEADTGAKC